MYTPFEFVKKLRELTTDEEILEFVKRERVNIRDYETGDKISEYEYLAWSVSSWYDREYPEDLQEIVDIYFPDRKFTEEELDRVYKGICQYFESDCENLPSGEYLSFVLDDMRKKENHDVSK